MRSCAFVFAVLLAACAAPPQPEPRGLLIAVTASEGTVDEVVILEDIPLEGELRGVPEEEGNLHVASLDVAGASVWEGRRPASRIAIEDEVAPDGTLDGRELLTDEISELVLVP